MKKILICLALLLSLPFAALAEEPCPLCGGTSDLCLTDEYGVVYCSGTLVSYPMEQTASSYTVREGTSIIGEWAFAENDCLVEVILPEGVVMLGTGAFDGCNALERVVLPDSLLIISDMAFYYCTELTDVQLPQQLYAIGCSAFVDCLKLTSVDIPETVRYIGSEAFCNTGIKEIWLRMIFLETGYCILSPGYSYDPAPPVTIHMCDVVIEEELGSAINFYMEYEDWDNLTFVFDIPYYD